MNVNRFRLAFGSPLPPTPDGVADYSRELIPALADRCDLSVFTDDGMRPGDADIRTHHWRGGYGDLGRSLDQFDAVLLSLGNNGNYVAPLELVCRRPGRVHVLLHDLNLSGVYGHRSLAAGRPKLLLRDLIRAQSPQAAFRASAHFARTRRLPHMNDYAMLGDVVRGARGFLVHGPTVAGFLRGRGACPVAALPFGVSRLPFTDEAVRASARSVLGLPADAFVVGMIGTVCARKRTASVFRAVAALAAARMPDLLLVIAGAAGEEWHQAAGAAGAAGNTRFLGRLPLDGLLQAISALDVGLSLRWPVWGETSAPMFRMLAQGIPLVVTDTPPFNELGANGAVSARDLVTLIPPPATGEESGAAVSADPAEAASLASALDFLEHDPAARREKARAAWEFVRREHGWEQTAQAILSALVSGKDVVPRENSAGS